MSYLRLPAAEAGALCKVPQARAQAVDDLLIVLPRERAWLWPHELTSLGALVRCAVLVEVFGVPEALV